MFEQVAFPFSTEVTPWPVTSSIISPSHEGSKRWVGIVIFALMVILGGWMWWALSQKDRKQKEMRENSLVNEKIVEENFHPDTKLAMNTSTGL